jgi:hypothetical protein
MAEYGLGLDYIGFMASKLIPRFNKILIDRDSAANQFQSLVRVVTVISLTKRTSGLFIDSDSIWNGGVVILDGT